MDQFPNITIGLYAGYYGIQDLIIFEKENPCIVNDMNTHHSIIYMKLDGISRHNNNFIIFFDKILPFSEKIDAIIP